MIVARPDDDEIGQSEFIALHGGRIEITGCIDNDDFTELMRGGIRLILVIGSCRRWVGAIYLVLLKHGDGESHRHGDFSAAVLRGD